MEGIGHILSISGGKDSTALSLRAKERLEAGEIENVQMVFADTGTGTSVDEIHHTTHGINAYVDWSRTARGGKQVDLIAVSEASEDIPLCSSIYGLCE